MIKMYLNDEELTPVGLGAQKVDLNGEEILIVTFSSGKSLNEVIELFNSLPDSTVIKIANEKREQIFIDFVSLDEEINVKVNEDNTFCYSFRLHKKSVLEIAQQAQADVEYLAAISGVKL